MGVEHLPVMLNFGGVLDGCFSSKTGTGCWGEAFWESKLHHLRFDELLSKISIETFSVLTKSPTSKWVTGVVSAYL